MTDELLTSEQQLKVWEHILQEMQIGDYEFADDAYEVSIGDDYDEDPFHLEFPSLRGLCVARVYIALPYVRIVLCGWEHGYEFTVLNTHPLPTITLEDGYRYTLGSCIHGLDSALVPDVCPVHNAPWPCGGDETV